MQEIQLYTQKRVFHKEYPKSLCLIAATIASVARMATPVIGSVQTVLSRIICVPIAFATAVIAATAAIVIATVVLTATTAVSAETAVVAGAAK